MNEAITDDKIASALAAEDQPEAAATALLAQALSGDAKDNITAIVVNFQAAAE